VAGDLIIQEAPGSAISDIVRFNPANTAPGYPASVVFYSDNDDPSGYPADVGFPSANYTNVLTVVEVGPPGNNGFLYTPTSTQPGFVPGFAVTYNIQSDLLAVPEPSSLALFGVLGMLGGAGYAWRKRQRRGTERQS
jgi:hypothetical protein